MTHYHANHSTLRLAAIGGLLLAVALAIGAGLGARGTSPALAAGDAVPGQYIVVLQPDTNAADVANEMAQANGLGIQHVYSHALSGFAARIPDARLARIQADPRVLSVEPDQVVTLLAGEVPTGVERIFADDNTNIGIDGVDDVRVDVDVAVIDTGIDLTHPDLNVVHSVNCSGGSPFKSSCGSGGNDDNGHGSHVAGTIGALDNGFGVVGVAPGARLWAVKVLNSQGSGYMSWIVAGIDYVAANAADIEVANMSLGCECASAAMNTAISNAVAAGVAFVVAAGNNDSNAATFSPANHPDVITVSALADFDGIPGRLGSPTCRADEDDTLANFSNWGSTVEIAAPGVCITSTWMNGGYNTISGTSMASPHVAGAAALLASMGGTTPAGIRSALVSNGNLDWTDDSGDGIKERLLDVSNTAVFAPATVPGSGASGPPPPTATSTPAPEPTATPTPTAPASGISLSANGYKVKGWQAVDLSWAGATGSNVVIHRVSSVLPSDILTANDGSYTDSPGVKGGGMSYDYQVCEETNPSNCSNVVTIIF